MDIQRPVYLQKLKARMHNGMIKVITGLRRCGKSYLLFNLYRNYLQKTGVPEEQIIGLASFECEYTGNDKLVARVEIITTTNGILTQEVIYGG